MASRCTAFIARRQHDRSISKQNDYYFILYGMGPIPNNLPWERIHKATALMEKKKIAVHISLISKMQCIV